jgi:catechol 2,3-dioxygenase-like lactoylglutathione lyase family enzyme
MTSKLHSSREVILRTNKWVEAVQFYETTLGFKVVLRRDTLVGFDTGAFILYVEKGTEHTAVFELLTHEVQATKARLLASGCVLVEEDPNVPRCYLKDPFGLVFNLGTRDSGVP